MTLTFLSDIFRKKPDVELADNLRSAAVAYNKALAAVYGAGLSTDINLVSKYGGISLWADRLEIKVNSIYRRTIKDV